jgi:PAS domain S-box-containing protein
VASAGLHLPFDDPTDTILVVALACALIWSLVRRGHRTSERLQSIAKLASDAIVVLNDSGEIVSWSAAAERVFGEPANVAIGSTIWKRMPAGLEALYSRAFEDIVHGRIQVPETPVAISAVRADGTEFDTELSISTFTERRRTFVITAFRDISERARNDRELRAAHDLSQAVLDAATEYSIIATDSSGRITVFNRGAERMLGYQADDIVGKENILLLHDRAEIAAHALDIGAPPTADIVFLGAGSDVEAREWTYVRRDNTRLPVLVTANVLTSADGAPRGFICIAHDLTDQRQAERRVAFANAAFQKAFNSAPVAIVLTRADMTCLHANPAFRRLTGYSLEELRTMSMLDMVVPVDDAELERLVDDFEPLITSERQVQVGEAHMRRHDGSAVRIEFHVSVILDEDNAPLLFVTHVEDVTAKREAEAAAQEAFDRNAEALEHLEDLNRAKTQFVSMVSHELRTPTTSVLGYTELIADGELGPITPEQRHALDAIQRNSMRLEQLLADLMEAARLELPQLNGHREHVDISEVVRHAATTMLPVVARRSQSMEIDVDPNAGIVLGDERRLEHVVSNLLTNAVKFTPEGGSIVVRAIRQGSEAIITVQDSGIGIPEEEHAKVFERFYRSERKESAKVPGSGLGLSIVKAIAKNHGGDVTLASAVGEGTTISIRLPRVELEHAAVGGGREHE